MALACLLVTVEHRKSLEILRNLRSMPEVIDAFMVFGQYDLVVFLKGNDYAELATLSAEINAISGIRKTETLIAG